jgi:hypothetical protein
MIQAAPAPKQIKEEFQKRFEARMPKAINKASMARLLDGLTGVIRTQNFNDGEGVSVNISAGSALSVARSVFEARMAKLADDSQEKTQLKEALSLLNKAFANLGDKAEALEITLKASDEVLGGLEQALTKFMPTKSKNKPEQAEELKLINQLIKDAEFYSIDSSTTKLDVNKFQSFLTKSLKENSAMLSNETKIKVLEQIKDTRLFASAFSSFGVLPQLMNASKTLLPDEENKDLAEQLAQGKFSSIELKDREAVTELLKETVDAYGENCKTMDPEAALKKALGETKLSNKLDALNDNQKIFFNHLVSKYQDLKASEPNEWVAKLTESLPSLIVPGIIGAIFAYVFGFSANLGAVGAAAMSFLGSLNNDSSPAAIQQVQTKQAPPRAQQKLPTQTDA